MPKIFYISDTHFGHKNIIKYAKRPYQTVWEMNDALINNWNKVVSDEDDVYHLGDFAFDTQPDKYFNQLKGIKHLIEGNHDGRVVRQLQWVSRDKYLEIKDGDKTVILFHYPITSWDKKHYGSVHLFGHVHGAINQHIPNMLENSYDVGVECIGYTPR